MKVLIDWMIRSLFVMAPKSVDTGYRSMQPHAFVHVPAGLGSLLAKESNAILFFKTHSFLVIWTWLIGQKIDPDSVIPIWLSTLCFTCRSFLYFLCLQFKGSFTSNKFCGGSYIVTYSLLISVHNLLFTMTEMLLPMVVCSPEFPHFTLASFSFFSSSVVLDYFLGSRTPSL